MNWASKWRVRCLRVNQTVMKSFSSPLKRRYQRYDAVRSVTSWRSAATRKPPVASSRSAQASMRATAAAISSSSGRSTSGTMRAALAALDEAAGGQLVVQLHQRALGGAPGVAPGPQHRRRRQALGGQGLLEDATHGRGVRAGVVLVDQEPGVA